MTPLRAVGWAGFVLLCALPHARRLAHPSLYGDDLMRIRAVRDQPLDELLLRPFNHHIAPFFDLITWLTWHAGGARLAGAPAAYTLGAIVPFVLCAAAIGRLVRVETGSAAAALAAVALFNFSPVHVVETVWWYSGSNHMWGLFWTLLALLGAAKGNLRGLALTVIGSALAPSCSSMGFVAGPAVAIDLLARREGWSRLAAALPLLGTVSEPLISPAFGHAVLPDGAARLDPAPALLALVRAPVAVLVPGLAGVTGLEGSVPPGVDLVLFVVGVVAVFVWAASSPRRPLILASLVLILGGYAIIFPFRTAEGVERMLLAARYHLYPHLGLVLLVAVALGPRLQRLDSRPALVPLAGSLLAAALLARNSPTMSQQADVYDFPDQRPTLAAVDRVEAICRARGITREQALAAFPTTERDWSLIRYYPLALFPQESEHLRRAAESFLQYYPLALLPPLPGPPAVPDNRVRATILAGLTPAQREGVFGGMRVCDQIVPDDGRLGTRIAATGRPVAAAGTLRVGPNRYIAEGTWGTYLEFDMTDGGAHPDPARGARYLSLWSDVPNLDFEIWWSDGDGHWSQARTVRWCATPRCGPGRDCALDLARVPHWDPSRARRLRFVPRLPVPFALEAPRYLAPAGPSAGD